MIFKEEDEIRTLIITHIDLDGFGCVMLFNYFNYTYHNMLMSDYSEYEDRQNDFNYQLLSYYDKIIYADFSPDQKSMNIIEENNIECIILDHHEARLEELNKWDYNKKTYIFDNEKCGTKIVFEWLKNQYRQRYPKHLLEVIKYINAYDLWHEEEDKENFAMGKSLNSLIFKHANYAVQGLSKHIKYLKVMVDKIKYSPQEFYLTNSEVKLLKDDAKLEDELFLKACRKITYREDKKGNKFGILTLQKKISPVASRLLKKFHKLNYLVVINDRRKKELKVSLRSKGFNLFQLKNAKGHREAAGLSDVDNKFIEDLLSGKVYCLEYDGDYNNEKENYINETKEN